ncbi:hypothetical protein QJQ45_024003 [Haematococcus lacustris]|nr:hypothetical protein QJQ45_024003 [Haematococcus lacustris]
MPTSKYHPYKGKGGHAARCALCVKTTPAGLAGWVEIHVEGEAASYRSGQSVRAIGQVTTQMAEIIKACDNLVPALIPLAHRTCAESAAAALAVGKRLQGQEQPMPRQLLLKFSSRYSKYLHCCAFCGHSLIASATQCTTHRQGQGQGEGQEQGKGQDQGEGQEQVRASTSHPCSCHACGEPAATAAGVNQVVCYLLAEHDMDMRQLYKGAPAMRQHWGMAQRFSVPVWWSYGATAHFKGRHDSEGGVVKQWLRGDAMHQSLCSIAMHITSQLLLLTTARLTVHEQVWVIGGAWSSAHRRPSITKPFEAMPMFDQKRDDKHWDDECLTLLCSFTPDSVMQLCTLGKKLSVKMLNEYCKAVGLYVPVGTLRADIRYMLTGSVRPTSHDLASSGSASQKLPATTSTEGVSPANPRARTDFAVPISDGDAVEPGPSPAAAVEVPAGMGEEARLLSQLAEVATISKVPVTEGGKGLQLQVQCSQRNLAANSQRRFALHGVLAAGGAVAQVALPLELPDALLVAPSPSGDQQLVVKAGGEGVSTILQVWNCSRLVLELHVPRTLHGPLVNDAYFGNGAAWSPDGRAVAYTAEAAPGERTPAWGGAGGPEGR